jgi:hypothetical protein
MFTIELFEAANYIHHTGIKRADLTNKQNLANLNITTQLSLTDTTLINGDFAFNNKSKTM